MFSFLPTEPSPFWPLFCLPASLMGMNLWTPWLPEPSPFVVWTLCLVLPFCSDFLPFDPLNEEGSGAKRIGIFTFQLLVCTLYLVLPSTLHCSTFLVRGYNWTCLENWASDVCFAGAQAIDGRTQFPISAANESKQTTISGSADSTRGGHVSAFSSEEQLDCWILKVTARVMIASKEKAVLQQEKAAVAAAPTVFHSEKKKQAASSSCC